MGIWALKCTVVLCTSHPIKNPSQSHLPIQFALPGSSCSSCCWILPPGRRASKTESKQWPGDEGKSIRGAAFFKSNWSKNFTWFWMQSARLTAANPDSSDWAIVFKYQIFPHNIQVYFFEKSIQCKARHLDSIIQVISELQNPLHWDHICTLWIQ